MSAFLIFKESDLEVFTPILGLRFTICYILTICLVLLVTIQVQSVVFRTFEKLGNRHINIIILPTLKTIYILSPIYDTILILRAIYYPTKDIHGSILCYIVNYFELFVIILAQFQTFFITLYRYICIFHDGLLIKLDITPRMLAKLTVLSLFSSSLFVSFTILLATKPTLTLQSCLGNYAVLYERDNGYIGTQCTMGNTLTNFLCKGSVIAHIIIASNIPESYLLFKCYNFIHNQTESVKHMIGEISYQRRRR